MIEKLKRLRQQLKDVTGNYEVDDILWVEHFIHALNRQNLKLYPVHRQGTPQRRTLGADVVGLKCTVRKWCIYPKCFNDATERIQRLRTIYPVACREHIEWAEQATSPKNSSWIQRRREDEAKPVVDIS